MFRGVRRLVAWLAVALVSAAAPVAAGSDEQRLVDESRIALEALLDDENFSALERYLADARGVVIVPELVKAGFIFGGEAGTGVLLARDPETGAWSYPAFYTTAAGSFGLQIGAQVAKVVFVVMTDGGLETLMSDKVKLGGDASVAAGPVGAGAEAATTLNVDADVIAFAHAKGLFGGISFEGAALVPDEEANEAYYGETVSSRGVVIERRVANPGADPLRSLLAGP